MAFGYKRGNERLPAKGENTIFFKRKPKKIDEALNQIEFIKEQYDSIDPSSIERFNQFPLTYETQKGLSKCKFTTPTDIQKEAIGLALKGHDILGAAQTGSGKTLAFVVPILERLYVAGWTLLDGLGVLIITPTRELAYQIFEVLNKVGSFHQFSVALAIGGKDLQNERGALNKCNIVICTPGRLLQHMDETPLFDAVNLQVLVLDEADRILDLGFQKTMDAIIANLPNERQTLLFSATQTKSVKELARLSLKEPMYVSVHENAKHSTPESLKQNYIVCEAESKMNLLWSFVKNHKKQKVLVFLASCKQVKYTYEVFCKMRPGISILALYGSLSQPRRLEIYNRFFRQQSVVLFATDLASRGLDFPNVNWVVQMDCPEDVKTYIHRAGRTARFEDDGECLLVLLPSEKDSMLAQLEKEKIPINEIKANPKKLVSIQNKLQVLCAQDVNLKESGQRACQAYAKNIFLMKDKTVFDIQKIKIEEYAKSLGLAFAPRTRFINKKLKEQGKALLSVTEKVDELAEEKPKLALVESSDEAEDDFLVAKKADPVNVKHCIEELSTEELASSTSARSKKSLTKVAAIKKVLKKNISVNTKVKYDEDGNPIEEVRKKQNAPIAKQLGEEILVEGYSVDKAMQIMKEEDLVDKELHRQIIKERHREKRFKLKDQKRLERGREREKAPEEELSSSADEDMDSDLERYIDDLPDPDKYYGGDAGLEDEEEEKSDAEIHSRTSDAESEADTPSESRKRKKNYIDSSRKKAKQVDLVDSVVGLPNSAFDEDEDLVLKLLQG